MARYFFNTFRGGQAEHQDDLGEELPSREAAWKSATRFAADLLRDVDGKLRTDVEWRLEIVKEDRSRAFQIIIHADEVQPLGRPGSLGHPS